MVKLSEIKNQITLTKRIEMHKKDLINFKKCIDNCKNKREKDYYMDNFFNYSICATRYFDESVQEFDDHDYFLSIMIDSNEYKDYYLQNIRFFEKVYKSNFNRVIFQLKIMQYDKNIYFQINERIKEKNEARLKWRIECLLERQERKKTLQYKHNMRKYFKNNIKKELIFKVFKDYKICAVCEMKVFEKNKIIFSICKYWYCLSCYECIYN